MRKILFRGQTRRKGEKVRMGDGKPLESNWVYGGIFPQNNGGDFAIIYSQDPVEKFPVYADTVGQYAGLKDRNRTRIFESDIVADIDSGNIGVVKFGVYNLKHYGFYIEWMGNIHYRNDICYWAKNRLIKIIGNIFDNPELLRKESEE